MARLTDCAQNDLKMTRRAVKKVQKLDEMTATHTQLLMTLQIEHDRSLV